MGLNVLLGDLFIFCIGFIAGAMAIVKIASDMNKRDK